MHRQAKQEASSLVIVKALVLISCFCLYLWWSFNLPMSSAPDEYMRLDVPLYIVNHGSLPHGGDPEIRNPIWGFSYAFTVYGSSLLAVIPMSILKLFGLSDTVAMLIAARFVNVCLSTATVFLCFQIGSRLFKGSSYASVLFGVFVGFLPQFVFLSAYFNCECLEIFSVALVILSWLRGIESHWRLGDCVLLGVALGICSLSYYFAYGTILVSIPLYYLSAYHGASKNSTAKTKLRLLLYQPIIVFLSAFAVAGWFFIWNAFLYEGDFLGLKTQSFYIEEYGSASIQASAISPKGAGLSILGMLTSTRWIIETIKSSIGTFGYMNVFISRKALVCYLALILFGLISAGVFFVKRFRHYDFKTRLLAFCFLALMLIPIVISVYYSWSSGYQPQGRYVFAGLIPAIAVVAWGYKCTLNRLSKAIASKQVRSSLPDAAKISKVLYSFLIVLWILLFAYILIRTILPQVTGALI